MLSRLAELRESSAADVPSEKPPEEEKSAQAVDIEHLELTEEFHELYAEILRDEGATIQACDEVRQRIETMEEIVALECKALLPTELARLANRFESQELVCQRMIRRAKQMLTTLRADDQDYDEEDDIAHIALRPVRASIARVRAIEFRGLVQAFFAARSHNRQEMTNRAARQLRFAYPDALQEELDDIMEFPELAMVAISRRSEKGSEVTLDGILGEMEGRKADAKKLEQGAKELKLMFLQFAEIIDNQEEGLSAIEANIKTAMEETGEAIGILMDAEAEKRAYERKKLKWFIVLGLLLVYFVIWPAYKAVSGEKSSQWSVGGLYHSAFHSVLPDLHAKIHGDSKAPAAAAPAAAAPAAANTGAKGKESPKAASLAQIPQLPPGRFHQLSRTDLEQSAPEHLRKLETHHPTVGLIAAHEASPPRSFMQSVALNARGGAARRSAFRKKTSVVAA